MTTTQNSVITEKTVTLDSVKCITPSTGMSEAVIAIASLLITTLGDKTQFVELSSVLMASYATGGTLIRVKELSDLEDRYLANEDLLKELDKKCSGSDDLYVKMGGSKVWPSGDDYKSIESQQTKTVGKSTVFPDITSATETTTIELWEYDWGSGDDHMGTLTIPDSHPDGSFTYVVTSSGEGSAYELNITVSSKKFGPK